VAPGISRREGVVGANEILIAEDNEANRLLALKQL
jgi:hypothetical protein